MGILSGDDIALLQEPHIAHVGTTMRDGSPQITPVWIDTDGENILFNTARGRTKERNIRRNPNVAVSMTDKDNPYRVLVVRGQAEIVEEGADEHIDKLAKKYLGADSYPFRQPEEQRVIVKVTPTRKMQMPG